MLRDKINQLASGVGVRVVRKMPYRSKKISPSIAQDPSASLKSVDGLVHDGRERRHQGEVVLVGLAIDVVPSRVVAENLGLGRVQGGTLVEVADQACAGRPITAHARSVRLSPTTISTSRPSTSTVTCCHSELLTIPPRRPVGRRPPRHAPTSR